MGGSLHSRNAHSAAKCDGHSGHSQALALVLHEYSQRITAANAVRLMN